VRHQGQFLVPDILLYWGITSVLISVVEKKKGSLHSEPSLHKLINYKLNQIEFWWCKGTTKN
jgi:hypothetical protein